MTTIHKALQSTPQPLRRQEPPAAPSAAKPVPAGDRLDIAKAPRDRLLEADLRLRLVDGPSVLANGQIGFSRLFTERLLQHALGKSKAVSNATISFDPTRRAYTVRASVTKLGMTVPFTVDLKPEVIGQGVGFKLDNLRIPLGDSSRFGIQHRWITGKVCKELASELQWSLGTKAHPDQGVVTLDPNTLLRHLNALPAGLTIDLAKTQLGLSATATGDLNLAMKSHGMAPAENRSPQSDLTLEADSAGLQALLKGALAPDYEVSKVSLRDGGGKIDGSAEFKDGSDVVNAGKVLIALLGLAAGHKEAANMPLEASRMMIRLDLDFTIEGTELTVKPSITKALGELAKTFEAAGLAPVQDGNSLRMDLNAVLKDRGRLDAMQFRQDGLQVRMKLDLDTFIANPTLTARD